MANKQVRATLNESVIVVPDFITVQDYRHVNVTAVHKDGSVTCSDGERYYDFSLFPIRLEQRIKDIVQQRAQLQKAVDESMNLVYELNNQLARGEI